MWWDPNKTTDILQTHFVNEISLFWFKFHDKLSPTDYVKQNRSEKKSYTARIRTPGYL